MGVDTELDMEGGGGRGVIISPWIWGVDTVKDMAKEK